MRVDDVTTPLAGAEQQVVATASPSIFQSAYEPEPTGLAVLLQAITS